MKKKSIGDIISLEIETLQEKIIEGETELNNSKSNVSFWEVALRKNKEKVLALKTTLEDIKRLDI